jgi:hypothetical protein
MTSEGLGRCLKVTLKTCVPENFYLCQWGAERRVSRAQTRGRGPQSAQAEIFILFQPQKKSFEVEIQIVLLGAIDASGGPRSGPIDAFRGPRSGAIDTVGGSQSGPIDKDFNFKSFFEAEII